MNNDLSLTAARINNHHHLINYWDKPRVDLVSLACEDGTLHELE